MPVPILDAEVLLLTPERGPAAQVMGSPPAHALDVAHLPSQPSEPRLLWASFNCDTPSVEPELGRGQTVLCVTEGPGHVQPGAGMTKWRGDSDLLKSEHWDFHGG